MSFKYSYGPLLLVPSNRLLKLNATAAKDIQSAANGQVNLATAERLHQFQVLQVASTTGVGDGNGTDGRQELHKLGVNTGLLAFDIGCMDQELCAVRLKKSNVFLSSQWTFGVSCGRSTEQIDL